VSAEETCPSCGRTDHAAYMCWRVGRLINLSAAEANQEYAMPVDKEAAPASIIQDSSLIQRMKELQSDNDRLRRALLNISEFCVACPDTAHFAARILDGSARPEKE
jgi:hypothetical protein